MLSLHHRLIDLLYICLSNIFCSHVIIFGGPVSNLNTWLTSYCTTPAWFIVFPPVTHKCCVSPLAGTFGQPREILSCDVQCIFVLLWSMWGLQLLNSWTGLYYFHNSTSSMVSPNFHCKRKVVGSLLPRFVTIHHVCFQHLLHHFVTIDSLLTFPIFSSYFSPLMDFLWLSGIIVDSETSSPPCHPLIVPSFLSILGVTSFIPFLPFRSVCFIPSPPWNIPWVISDFLTLISASLPGPAHPRQEHSVSRHDKWQGRKWARPGSHDLD